MPTCSKCINHPAKAYQISSCSAGVDWGGAARGAQHPMSPLCPHNPDPVICVAAAIGNPAGHRLVLEKIWHGWFAEAPCHCTLPPCRASVTLWSPSVALPGLVEDRSLASKLPWGCLWGRTWAGAMELRGHRGRAQREQSMSLITQQAVNCLLRASSQLLP